MTISDDEYEIKIMNEQIKIQAKSSIANVNITKELKSKKTEYHINKLKQERSFKIVFKHIHVITNLTLNDDIKKEIEDLEHTVTNIWNIKK